MKKTIVTKIKAVLVALTLIIPAGTGMKVAAQDGVEFYRGSWDGEKVVMTKDICRDYVKMSTISDDENILLTEGWYYVDEFVRYHHRIKVLDHVHIILGIGTELTCEEGIETVTDYNGDDMYPTTLEIYDEGLGDGSLIAEMNEDGYAGIGGDYYEYGGEVIIHGGRLRVQGDACAAGIGGGNTDGGVFTMYNGELEVTSGHDGAAIGGGADGSGDTTTIYGGKVKAYANTMTTTSAAAIGAGNGGINGGKVDIYGGTVSAVGFNGAGIGGARGSFGAIVNIYGGTVDAKGSDGGAGIGGGERIEERGGYAFDVNIQGGDVTAIGGEGAAGIGGGKGADQGEGDIPDKEGKITIEKGTVTAVGGKGAAGIGGGMYSEGGAGAGVININGGEVNATASNGESGSNAEAIGRGSAESMDDIALGEINLFDQAMVVKTDADSAESVKAKKNERVEFCRSLKTLVKQCDHEDGDFTITDEGHSVVCKYCNAELDGLEPHINENGKCKVCGYETEEPTTVEETTTEEPTTVEETTTEEPTTVEETTTEEQTTIEETTTEEPTTIEETTTEEPTTVEETTTEETKVDAPTGLIFYKSTDNKYIFAWNQVNDADHYVIYLNGHRMFTTTSRMITFDVSDFSEPGKYTIGVSAVKNDVESDVAETEYTVVEPTTQETTTEEPTTVEETTTEEITTAEETTTEEVTTAEEITTEEPTTAEETTTEEITTEEPTTAEETTTEEITTAEEKTTAQETTEVVTDSTTEQITEKASTTKSDETETIQNKKPTSIKSIKAKKKSLKIVWKKVKGIKGYQIKYSLYKKCKKKAKIKKIKKYTVTSCTLKKLKSKKKYYVMIRTYMYIDEEYYYSKWSKCKAKKTK